jgi:hypothetical protein
MSRSETQQAASYEYLGQEIDRLQHYLVSVHLNGESDFPLPNLPAYSDETTLALNCVSIQFKLNPAERLLLLFIAAWEIEVRFKKQCAALLELDSDPEPFPHP